MIKPSVNQARSAIAALVLTASTLVGLAVHEGYEEEAYVPVSGDVPTIGFGTTAGVKMGDKTDPVRSLIRLMDEVEDVYAAGVKRCVKVSLYQHEYDALVSLTYNIGVSAFCGSTLVRKLNSGDYEGAGKEILRWNKFNGKPLKGLTIRRETEYKLYMGLA
ncbi:lysozyme [Nitrosovibrio sp. Nv4]|uniref:lysozyme n=1 Tax=Nitrosovibrio sp. Nv4 TaxID=1945880 RepID=UPI000BCBF934|nr:lysozyme [Nitrosovibrio sp. Nv4]SOD42359.1 lysozyme [Nitrosovibrio sp. Nv4]